MARMLKERQRIKAIAARMKSAGLSRAGMRSSHLEVSACLPVYRPFRLPLSILLDLL